MPSGPGHVARQGGRNDGPQQLRRRQDNPWRDSRIGRRPAVKYPRHWDRGRLRGDARPHEARWRALTDGPCLLIGQQLFDPPRRVDGVLLLQIADDDQRRPSPDGHTAAGSRCSRWSMNSARWQTRSAGKKGFGPRWKAWRWREPRFIDRLPRWGLSHPRRGTYKPNRLPVHPSDPGFFGIGDQHRSGASRCWNVGARRALPATALDIIDPEGCPRPRAVSPNA